MLQEQTMVDCFDEKLALNIDLWIASQVCYSTSTTPICTLYHVCVDLSKRLRSPLLVAFFN